MIPIITQTHSFDRRVLYLLVLFDPLILLYRFGRDGGRGFALRGVVLLNVSCGSGDSPPSFATTDTDCDAKQDQ